MPKRRIWEVAPSGTAWTLKERGGSSARAFNKKEDAVEAGRTIARANQPSQLIIKLGNGQIETEHTYGDDPNPPRG